MRYFSSKLGDDDIKDINLNLGEALALALITMAGIDGELDDSEFKYLHSINIEDNERDHALEIYGDSSIMECVDIVAKCPNAEGKFHLMIIKHIATMAGMDGKFSLSEELLLDIFVEKLDVTVSDVSKYLKN